MQIHIFSQADFLNQIQLEEDNVRTVLELVADGTDTSNLVVSVYFVPRTSWIGGTAFVRNWNTSSQFATTRGKWKITKYFGTPPNLPERYKLIRLLPTNEKNYQQYPVRLRDGYGWMFSYAHFNDQLAMLFAHELHHFRRYHLNLHPREGENAANRWALNHVQQLGFSVGGHVEPAKRKRHSKGKRSFRKIFYDPFSDFRSLSKGQSVYIHYDPRGKYEGSLATVVRPIRANSRRIAIRTTDSREWLWPMDWLKTL